RSAEHRTHPQNSIAPKGHGQGQAGFLPFLRVTQAVKNEENTAKHHGHDKPEASTERKPPLRYPETPHF
ncbi:MAG: hypothetical protein V2I33_26070, partial [Kangiellaceae bacterium]|nr:hypothetical protein [Kangiellaceae bacterium]